MSAPHKPLDTLQSIRTRRTVKVLSETPLPTVPADEGFIDTLLTSAYWAPQHYPCFVQHQQHLPSPLPWRFYVLDSQACRDLAVKLTELDITVGKVNDMLNSADYLLQATWCPLPQSEQVSEHADTNRLFDGNVVNMEHIAAAGAAVQNVLLTATALGHENYWSSGGPLREAPVFELMGIPTAEILLGSLFIFPSQPSAPEHVQYLPSKRRDQRGALSDSYRWVTL